MSLLSNEKVSAILELVGTRDLDANLVMDNQIKIKMIGILKSKNLVYDELSRDIWIPSGSKFEKLFKFSNVEVFRLDAESALVSKAVKAKEKNKSLIQEAIASEKFSKLIDRIEDAGGDLKYFLE